MSYIPDMTERFPEGMNGVDMTDRYFAFEEYRNYIGCNRNYPKEELDKREDAKETDECYEDLPFI